VSRRRRLYCSKLFSVQCSVFSLHCSKLTRFTPPIRGLGIGADLPGYLIT